MVMASMGTALRASQLQTRHNSSPSPLPSGARPREGAYQLLEEVAHGDIAVPLLHLRAQAVVELLVDLIDILDLVENRLDLLEGEDRLRRGGRGLQWLHGLPKKGEFEMRAKMGDEEDLGQMDQGALRARVSSDFPAAAVTPCCATASRHEGQQVHKRKQGYKYIPNKDMASRRGEMGIDSQDRVKLSLVWLLELCSHSG